jgi:membrane protein
VYFAVDQKKLRDYFIDHNLLHYASSLSFHTILALIPILLISLYLFVHLDIFAPYLEHIKQFIFTSIIPVQQEYIAQNIDEFMKNAYKMGLLGLIFVLYVSVMFFDDFEYVINRIYGVCRWGWRRRFT